MDSSDDRLSTRDIASPGGAETDAPPQRFERADRDFDDDAVAADRAEPVGDGDVVTDERAAGRGPARESVAEPTDTRDDVREDTRAAPAPAAAAAAPRDTGAADTAATTDRDSTTNGTAPLVADA